MRVALYPSDEGGVGHYRLLFVAEALGSADVLINPSIEAHWRDLPSGPRLVGIRRPDCDVVVFQRPCKRELADAIPHLQDHGVAVVVEVDDDHQVLDPTNPCFADFHPRLHPDRNWQHLARACRLADLVTVSTPALADRYGRHGRVCVLPNYVPQAYLGVTRVSPPLAGPVPLTGPVMGWTGTPRTHHRDLEMVGMAVSRALDATEARFLAIGSEATAPLLGVPAGRGDTAAWRDLRDGYPELVASLDVGIAPVAPSAFNRSKSWLKPLEYAALGVACVMSPSPEYVRLHSLGAGELAGRPREWERLLRRLLGDEGWRGERAEAGRVVAKRLTYELHAERWWVAWRQALEHRVTARCA